MHKTSIDSQESINDDIKSDSFSFILSHIPQNPPFKLSKRQFAHISSCLQQATSTPEIYCIALIHLIYLSQHPPNESTNANANEPHADPILTPGELASNLYLLLAFICIIYEQTPRIVFNLHKRNPKRKERRLTRDLDERGE